MSSNTQRLSRREQRRVDRSEAIKQAAIEVFSEKGYHGAKVSEIVERVGVAQGTFYLYYEGKQQLFGELLQDFLTLVVQTVGDWEPASLASREDLRDALTRVGAKLTEVLLEHRSLAAIFFKEAAASPDFAQTVSDFNDTLATLLTSFNEILHARGLIAKMNFRILAFATIGQVERIISEYVVTQALEGVDARELVDHLVMVFLAGTTEPIPTRASQGATP